MLKPLPNCARAAIAAFPACVLFVSAAFCQDSGKTAVATHGDAQVQQSGTTVVAHVGDVEIRQADVDRYIGHEVEALTQRLYLLRKQALNSMIDSTLVHNEAARQHIDVAQLLQREVKAPHPPSTDEVEREWSNNYDSLRPLGEVAGRYQVVLNMETHARSEELRQYLDRLRTENHVAVLLEPPVVKLQARPGSNHLGNGNGSLELVVFHDYECPFCRKLEPELESALRKPGLSDIKVTIKQFPLSMHKGAFDAAVAAECAGQQNKFRAMHDLLITNQDHGTDSLAATATQAGLDVAKFRSCMVASDAKAQVLLDMDEARKNGIDGTPTLFLDGQAIDLPNSPEDLRKVLEAKLKPHDETYSRLQTDATADDQTRK